MDREKIEDIFDIVYETGALIVKSAEGNELSVCVEDLISIGMPALPADYIEFLEIANGFAWNGFEFFGTYQVTVKKQGYVLRDIVSVNKDWHDRKLGLEGKLVLGQFDDDIYIYDPETKKYQALDNMTLTEIDTYDSFDGLFVCSVGLYTDFDDEEYSYDDEEDPFEDGTSTEE
ncbi:MAG: YrhA family protein [Lachnospiraceae bacterium]|nr:YrhA family protein [Lachnospiraceae bacterium]